MNDAVWRSAAELARGFRNGSVSPVEAVEASLARAAEIDPSVRAMVTTTHDLAREQARSVERALAAGDALPALAGIPVTVKDLTDTAGVVTTYGSPLYRDHVPDTDALAWARLKQEGVSLIGKTATPEYGMLGITESMLTGNTSTPWKIGYNSGGSSGGSAASVAAGVVPVSWGSDGGGSIRVPSALCGVVGIKPTTGLIPHADNEDPDSTEGPIARTVEDAALLLDATHGRHRRDRLSVPKLNVRFAETARSEGDLTGLRIAATADLDQGSVDPEVRAAFEASLRDLERLGATVTDVTPVLPDVSEFFIGYWGPEFIGFVDEMDAAGQDIWDFIRRVADRARALRPEQASAAMRGLKTRLYNGYLDVFEQHDAIVTPTTPVVAQPHPENAGADTLNPTGPIAPAAFELHRLTEPPSHAGIPAITLPNGFTRDGLPTGLQVVAPMYEDARAIYIASRFERATDWHLRRPAL